MNKRTLMFVALLLFLLFAVGVVLMYCTMRPQVEESIDLGEARMRPSIAWVDKSCPERMKLLVKKYNIKSGLYEEPEDYLIKGMVYQVVKIGQAPPWYDCFLTSPYDPAYKARVDANKDGVLCEDEKEVGDFQLMKNMGVNTIRLYDPPGFYCNPDPFIITRENVKRAKEVLRKLYHEFGIMVIMGHSLGCHIDYSDECVRRDLYNEVIAMVEDYKDEPWVLMWNLGNENNIHQGFTSGDFAVDFYQNTVQKIASKIKEIDPNHPISISNMGLAGIYDFHKHCPDVDILGANMYQSRNYSGLWNTAARIGRPTYLTEFGCDALDSRQTPRVPEEGLQAAFVAKQWEDIEANHKDGAGTSLGGVYFEWLDEWWKTGDPCTHTKEGGWDAPLFDTGTRESGNEEWWGICAQHEEGLYSPIYRHLRQVYHTLQNLWREDK